MYLSAESETFKKKMRKLRKKDIVRLMRVRKKVEEILQSPHSYRPLGNVMAGVIHVHIDPYVITFRIDEESRTVVFLDFDHHDRIFRN